jgi:hypothetical protein
MSTPTSRCPNQFADEHTSNIMHIAYRESRISLCYELTLLQFSSYVKGHFRLAARPPWLLRFSKPLATHPRLASPSGMSVWLAAARRSIPHIGSRPSRTAQPPRPAGFAAICVRFLESPVFLNRRDVAAALVSSCRSFELPCPFKLPDRYDRYQI